MREIQYKVQYIDINLLKPHSQNPRIIKDDCFYSLCQSIQDNPEYFETRPILCDKDFTIWAGNQRFRGAVKVGLKEVPTVILDLPEAKLRELMIRDNVANGKWDAGLLASLYENKELEKWGVDLGQFGVDTGDEEEQDKETASTETKPTIKLVFENEEDKDACIKEVEEFAKQFHCKVT